MHQVRQSIPSKTRLFSLVYVRRGKEQMSNISNPWCKLWAITLLTNSVGMTYLGILRSSWLVPTAPQCEDTQGITLNVSTTKKSNGAPLHCFRVMANLTCAGTSLPAILRRTSGNWFRNCSCFLRQSSRCALFCEMMLAFKSLRGLTDVPPSTKVESQNKVFLI